MTFSFHKVVAALAATVALAISGPASSQETNKAATGPQKDILIEAGKFDYKPGPKSLPKGAEHAVIYGNPSQEGLFAMRLKLPSGYKIAPHSHTQPEVVTVISGSFEVGMGKTAERKAATKLEPGSFFAFQPGHEHFAFVGEKETVVQLNSTGPWTIKYVDSADDPRETN